MENLYVECDRRLASLKAEWEALTPAEQQAEIADYEYQVVSSIHDAFDHRYHAIFTGW